jgi:hypothetical protein
VERKKVFGDCIKEFLEKGREVDNYINPYFDKNATSETKFIKRKIEILKLLLESSHVYRDLWGDKIGSLLQAIGIMGVARLSVLWRTNVQCSTVFSPAVSNLYQAYR